MAGGRFSDSSSRLPPHERYDLLTLSPSHSLTVHLGVVPLSCGPWSCGPLSPDASPLTPHDLRVVRGPVVLWSCGLWSVVRGDSPFRT